MDKVLRSICSLTRHCRLLLLFVIFARCTRDKRIEAPGWVGSLAQEPAQSPPLRCEDHFSLKPNEWLE